MLIERKELIEGRGEDPAVPIEGFQINNIFVPAVLMEYWAQRASLKAASFGSAVSLAGIGAAFLGANLIGFSNHSTALAQACDSQRFASWDNSYSTLGLYSQCEGPASVWTIWPLSELQKRAQTKSNVLTTNLGRRTEKTLYEWLNFPYQEFPLDITSGEGNRLVSDDILTSLLSGNVKTPEGSQRIDALQKALNNYASQLWGSPVTLDFSNISDFYIDDSDQYNTLDKLTVDNLRFFGVSDGDIFRDNSRIQFDQDGNPVSIKEWQTRVRGGNAEVEEDDEGWIKLSDNPNEITRFGIRSKLVPISLKLMPVNEDPNFQALVVIDRSCGNVVEMYSIPIGIIPTMEILIATLTATPTQTLLPTRTRTPTPVETAMETPTVFIPRYGGGGGGFISFIPTPEQTVIPPVFTPQPTPDMTPTVPAVFTPQPTVVPATFTPQPTPGTPTAPAVFTPQPTPDMTPTVPAVFTPQPTAPAMFTPGGI